ncbi:hypothetical protein CVT24_011812, partial [Panaeolus cyanescens]
MEPVLYIVIFCSMALAHFVVYQALKSLYSNFVARRALARIQAQSAVNTDLEQGHAVPQRDEDEDEGSVSGSGREVHNDDVDYGCGREVPN